jgi:hypothetical protein
MKQNSTILKSGVAALFIIGGVILFGSCEKYSFLVETVNPADTVHFQTEIQPIFTANCVSCHKGLRNPDLRDGNSISLPIRLRNLPAETSRLYLQVNSGRHHIRCLKKAEDTDLTARQRIIDHLKTHKKIKLKDFILLISLYGFIVGTG